jgi:hypothetical protein
MASKDRIADTQGTVEITSRHKKVTPEYMCAVSSFNWQ